MQVAREGDKIGECDCEGCGRTLSVKLNKNMCAYYFCSAIVGERNGKPERCLTRMCWGRTASAKLITEYEATLREGVKNNVENQNRSEQPAADAGSVKVADVQPAADGGKKPGGFAAGIKHFLTGPAS